MHRLARRVPGADFGKETEMDAAGNAYLARAGTPEGAEASRQDGRRTVAPACGLALRFALSASPCRAPQGRALGQATDHKNQRCHGPWAMRDRDRRS